MPHSIAFLFGAGASKGAGQALPYPPPLANQLYDELARYCPEEWGPKSPNHTHAQDFRDKFEETFSRVVLKIDVGPDLPPFTPDSLTLLERQRTLALYFSRFYVKPDGSDLYTKLLSSLSGAGLIKESFFTSLNYDCLFEQAAIGLGFQVDYSCEQSSQTIVQVAKVHGSCNFITEKLSQQDRAMLTSARYERGIVHLAPIGLENELMEKMSGEEHYPVMSQISPLKENVYAPVKMQAIRNKWNRAISTASTVVVIGVSHNPNDTHIIEAIETAPAQHLYYIGGNSDYSDWKTLKHGFQHLGQTFEEGFSRLLEVLNVSHQTKTQTGKWCPLGILSFFFGLGLVVGLWSSRRDGSP